MKKNDNGRNKGNEASVSGHEHEHEGIERSLNRVQEMLNKIAIDMEKSQIADYVDLVHHPFKLIWRNVLAGTARGVGIAIGFTFFAATILYVLQILGALNLPIIGDYIADIVRIVQIQLEGKTY
ncbi:DUF5665 domain-containing protein [Paenibacillus sp. NPDC058174]|uniref:DUF5665 domain-containing protein n=1 Tax=Paenibacillus sp. NPDC058174 TaxID=3346366 RepID=UPI0036DD7F8B